MHGSFLSELSWRGLLHQATHEKDLVDHLQTGVRRVYAGFDPTSDSLTIGNLIPIVLLRHAQQAGHVPIVVMGGGTGLIGDPSGKSSERNLLSEEVVENNISKQRRIFERLIDFSPGPQQAILLNNHDWLQSLSYIDVLRSIGKHFSVNALIQRDSIRDRLHGREQGISYTEFSYVLLQAYDFYHLAKHQGVSVQLGGSDQFGNIVSGMDLIRRLLPSQPAFGVTTPLLVKSDGNKFGKSEQGAVWLTADKTSPYVLYQFLLNTDDQDVMRLLALLSFLPQPEIQAISVEHAANPARRVAHRALAQAVTTWLHGSEACRLAEEAAHTLFSGDWSTLSQEGFQQLGDAVPSSTHPRALLTAGWPLLEALAQTSLVRSKREARELLQNGSIQLAGQPASPEAVLTSSHLLHGQFIPIRKGKKQWYLLRFEDKSVPG